MALQTGVWRLGILCVIQNVLISEQTRSTNCAINRPGLCLGLPHTLPCGFWVSVRRGCIWDMCRSTLHIVKGYSQARHNITDSSQTVPPALYGKRRQASQTKWKTGTHQLSCEFTHICMLTSLKRPPQH